MLCAEFEDRLTDYLDGSLVGETMQAFGEHALRCPVCHDLLGEVKNSLQALSKAEVPSPPPAELEARILLRTMPASAMTCEDFEEYLTDYLDGFLPANLYHRWERHAALCEQCTELPGQVVRAIGACYTYINEEMPVPLGMHEKILQATLGTTEAEEVRAPLSARLVSWLRDLLDPIVSPQFATVATMLLVAVLVLTSTVSADGSIGGMYSASVHLAERTYAQGANAAVADGLKQISDGITTAFDNNGAADENKNKPQPNDQNQKQNQQEQR
ncbi:MAG: hypothetical protein AUG51_02915 [Acidobacteria bacterium 13_1_20CM_3_53_8]|nr:MAG: hypothetical protein AUG51_02915 [Acidobacteria bacterium 13_1_20CM_3_53_8]